MDPLTVVIGLAVLQTIQVAIVGRDVRRSLRPPPPPPKAPPPLGGGPSWQPTYSMLSSQLYVGRRVRLANSNATGRITNDEIASDSWHVCVRWDETGSTSEALIENLLVERET